MESRIAGNEIVFTIANQYGNLVRLHKQTYTDGTRPHYHITNEYGWDSVDTSSADLDYIAAYYRRCIANAEESRPFHVALDNPKTLKIYDDIVAWHKEILAALEAYTATEA